MQRPLRSVRLPWRLTSLEPARDGVHKYIAVFRRGNDERRTLFGAAGYADFTMHHDEARRQRYLARHAGAGERWTEPTTAGALSRWLLWEKPTMKEALQAYKLRFRM